MLTSNFFKVIKSLTEELETFDVLFPERLTAEMILLTALFQLRLES